MIALIHRVYLANYPFAANSEVGGGVIAGYGDLTDFFGASEPRFSWTERVNRNVQASTEDEHLSGSDFGTHRGD